MVKLKELLIYGIIWTTTLTPELAWGEKKDGVPDILVKFSQKDQVPQESDCIGTRQRPSTEYIYKNDGSAAGFLCKPKKEFYNIRVPIPTNIKRFSPKRLTFTIDKEQDAIIPFIDKYSDVSWKQQPNGVWKNTTWNEKKEVVLPKNEIDGSGFYSFIQGSPDNDPTDLGTVALLIRECPKDKFGTDCKEWCPDCMYGGVCHPQTGECICPPGRIGDFCETACGVGWSGRNCGKHLFDVSEQVICLPFPYGCSCFPGFKGFLCNEICDEKHWGVECRQTCVHCKTGECDSRTGECQEGDQLKPCAGGTLGLPRLRRRVIAAPKSNGVFVVILNRTYDGEQPKISQISGFQVIIWREDQEMEDGVKKNIEMYEISTTIEGLTPGTKYYAAALVQIDLLGPPIYFCTVDGVLRGGRIQKTPFTTKCPKKPPTPSNILVNYVTNSSFRVTWNDIEFWKVCNIGYLLNITSDDGVEVYNEMINNSNPLVQSLRSYTNYNISVKSIQRNIGDEGESDPGVIKAKTLPKIPELPTVTFNPNGDNITVSWKEPKEAEGDIEYYHRYKIKHLACEKSDGFNPWSNKTKINEMFIEVLPYSKLYFELNITNEAGLNPDVFQEEYETATKVPSNSITTVSCKDEVCNVSLEEDCKKINGRNLGIAYKFEAKNDVVKKKEEENGLRELKYLNGTPNDSPKFQWSVNFPQNLFNFTEYVFMAFVTNDQGITNQTSETSKSSFITKPVSPDAVKHVSLSGAHNSITIKWSPPPTWPPTGELESYKITWGKDREDNTTDNNYIIYDLETNKEYNVSIYAKNKGVDEMSEPVTRTVKTVLNIISKHINS